MESSVEASNQLLKKKYDLHKSPEVESAAHRTEARTGEKVPQDPLVRIQNYLNRFHEIIDQDDPARREHALDLIKGRFHNRYVVKPSEIPEGFWENQRRIIRERGQGGDLERVDFEELKRQNTEAIIADQRLSLDKWIDYLSSPDAPYPDALKYFTLRRVLNMSEYDKEKKMYPQRSKGTTKPFPDLNREALAYVLDAVEKKYASTRSAQVKSEGNSPEFEKLLAGENFAKLYAWAIEKVTPASQEVVTGVQGKWIKYNQGSDHMPLVKSLQGHGTGWCTAGETTAQTQLKGGDFYVYYSLDAEGKPTIPRAAIRMDGNNIAEIRGIAKGQNLDPFIGGVVEEKLKEFPDGELYKKKVSDMKLLTEIENKTRSGQDLTAQDLIFLYEIKSIIEGFGYQKDPRIKELREQRNQEGDMPVVFGCDPSQIARSADKIRSDTKVYLGLLTPGIFNAIEKNNVEHVYTSFPEGRIRMETISIGGKTSKELQEELRKRKINISSYVEDMIKSKDFVTLKNPENLNLVRLKVQDIGLKGIQTTDEVYAQAKTLGLDLCPAEAGPHYRLAYTNQPINEWVYMAMKQILGRDGNPHVFLLVRHGHGLWLDDGWADPARRWHPGHGFIFSLRPPAGEASK